LCATNSTIPRTAQGCSVRDSGTNKDGVTSSSLEVLAGPAPTIEEYVDLMIFKDGKPSGFSQSYIKDGTRKTNLPRSTSVAYEKEAQSTATRRLNLRRYLQSTSTLSPSKQDGHVAHTVRSLVNNPVVNIHVRILHRSEEVFLTLIFTPSELHPTPGTWHPHCVLRYMTS
jgi:hypothetical protein